MLEKTNEFQADNDVIYNDDCLGRMRDPGLVWLVLVTVSQGAGAVVSPLDKVSLQTWSLL